MDENPQSESAIQHWRSVTADILRPVPYSVNGNRIPKPAAPAAKPAEKPDFPGALRRGKWLILGMAFLGTLYGLYNVINQVPLYQAATTLELMSPNQAFMGQGRLDPQGPDSYMVSNANIQTQLRLILGAGILKNAAERVALESPPLTIPNGGFFGKIRSRLHLLPEGNTEYLRAALRTARATSSARQLGTTKLIELSCQSVSAEVAANYLNDAAAEYKAQSAQHRGDSATKTVEWLKTQLEDSKGRVDDAEVKLEEFVSKPGLAFVVDQTLDNSKLKTLQENLAASQVERIQAQSRYDLAKSSPVESLPQILDDGTLKALDGELIGLRRNRAELLATLTLDHTKVKRIDAQIADLETSVQQAREKLVKRIEVEYDASIQREKLTKAAYDREARAVASQTDKSSQYNNLKRQLETERTGYNALLTQFNEMNVIAAVPSDTVRVIDVAVANYGPVKPAPARDIGMAFALAVSLALVFLVLKEMVHAKKLAAVFAAPGDTGDVLRIPELGTIPEIRANGMEGKKTALSLRMRSRDPLVDVTGWANQPFLAESIRHALTSILLRSGAEDQRVLVVSSAIAGEGKTTVTSNLGMAMAATGRRVLLVEADLRAPGLQGLFKLEGSPGLGDIYSSETPIADLNLSDYIRATSIPDLSLLASGQITAKAAGEIVFSRRLQELFARLRREYDYVLVDTPPTIQFSDARLLGQLSNGVILVIRSAVSTRESVSIAVQRFLDDGIPIIGTILNDWKPTRDSSPYGLHYNRTYRPT